MTSRWYNWWFSRVFGLIQVSWWDSWLQIYLGFSCVVWVISSLWLSHFTAKSGIKVFGMLGNLEISRRPYVCCPLGINHHWCSPIPWDDAITIKRRDNPRSYWNLPFAVDRTLQTKLILNQNMFYCESGMFHTTLPARPFDAKTPILTSYSTTNRRSKDLGTQVALGGLFIDNFRKLLRNRTSIEWRYTGGASNIWWVESFARCFGTIWSLVLCSSKPNCLDMLKQLTSWLAGMSELWIYGVSPYQVDLKWFRFLEPHHGSKYSCELRRFSYSYTLLT